MRMKTIHVVAAFVMVAVLAVSVEAAFIVEAHESGLANANFAGVGKASLRSYADGTTASNSVYSGSGAAGSTDAYVYSYTPGVDVDNTASSLPGGGSGLYSVFITWPNSGNVNAAGCTVTVTSNAVDPVVGSYDMNGEDENGNDNWLLIAENISLTAGEIYTVTQVANAWSWTAMRSHGVKWAAVPEPATMLLFGAGALLLRRRR